MTELRCLATIDAYERGWFARFTEEVRAGKPYVFSTLLIPRELFAGLELACIEDMSVVTGLKPASYYSELLATRGFHPGRGGATALGNGLALAVALDSPDPERFCGLPKPSLVVSTAGDRAAQLLAAHYRVPHFGIEIPSLNRITPTWWQQSRWQWEELDESHRIDMLVAQYRELIAACERIAGRRMDDGRLRAIVDLVNRQEECFDQVRELACAAPKMPFRMSEVERIVLCVQHNRGTQWAFDQAAALRDEVQARVDEGAWVCPDERCRLMWNGTLLRHDPEFFQQLERSHGVVFARSLFLSIASDGYLRYNPRDPVRALASRYVTMNQQAHIPPMSTAWILHEARRHRIDGALHQLPWEWYDFITQALEDEGIPVLKLHRNPATLPREALRRTITEFIEARVLRPR